MTGGMKEEARALGRFLRSYRREAIVVSMSTLFLLLHYYHDLHSKPVDYAVFLLAFPLLTIVALLRENPFDFGLRPGAAGIWRTHVPLACAAAVAVSLAGSRIPSVKAFYSSEELDIFRYLLDRLVIIFSLEFTFRGFILFGLKKRFSEGAILIQMIPFTILHSGKPEIEAAGCIISGLYLGYVSYRARSVWPAFVIHYVANAAIRIVS